MKWIRERDALIAQTMAFVQSVTGGIDAGERPRPVAPAAREPASPETARPEPARPETAPREPAAGNVAVATPPATAKPQVTPLPAPRPLVPGDFRRELQTRIESFRAHQERFNREREEYFSTTLARLRASIEDSSRPTPPKRR